MGNRKKKNESARDESFEEPEFYNVNIAKIAEDLKKSYRVVPEIAPQIVIDDFKEMAINMLHILGFDKYVTVEFNPIAYDKPLHTFIMVSKPLEEEWGKDKVNEFIKEFYNYAMERFAYTMNLPRGDVLDAEAEAVQLSAIELSGGYGFDAIIELYFNPTATGIDAYRVMWILVKK